MARGSKPLVVMVVLALGLWGCARPSGNAVTTSSERVRLLESRCVKLEQDYRTMSSAHEGARQQLKTVKEAEAVARTRVAGERDQLRVQLQAAQAEREALRKQVAERNRERDALQQQLVARTGERDGLQTRLDKLRKGMQVLLGGQDPTQIPVNAAAAPTGGPGVGGL